MMILLEKFWEPLEVTGVVNTVEFVLVPAAVVIPEFPDTVV
jgi:hypothetical protein